MRRVVVVAAVVLWASQALAQTVYNPAAVAWDKDGVVVTRFVLETSDALTPGLVVTTTLPGSVRQDAGTEWRIPFTVLPVMPVGRSYRLRLQQCDDVVPTRPCSDLSAYTPQVFRIQPCVAAGKLVLPSLAPTLPMPSPVRGQMAAFGWSFAATSAVRQLRMDLVGDNAPAWYFALPANPAVGTSTQVVTVLAGPFPRAGNFALEAWAVDTNGCEVSLGAGRRVVVQP